MGGLVGSPQATRIARQAIEILPIVLSLSRLQDTVAFFRELLAADRWLEDLVVVTRETATRTNAATDDPDETIDESRTVDAVNRDGHILKACPGVSLRIVV